LTGEAAPGGARASSFSLPRFAIQALQNQSPTIGRDAIRQAARTPAELSCNALAMPSLPLNPSIARNAPMALALDDRRAMFDFGRYQRAPEIAGSFGPPGGNGVAEHPAASAADTPKGDEGKI
jgi:hypothetical protein